jgi:hypothetical protein
MYFMAAITLLEQLKSEFLPPTLKHIPREDADELFGGKGETTLRCSSPVVTSRLPTLATTA